MITLHSRKQGVMLANFRTSRHHPVQAEVVQTNGHGSGVKLASVGGGVVGGGGQYVRGGRRQTRHCSDQDNVSHTSGSVTSGCVHTHSRQQSGSNNGSLRSGTFQLFYLR